MPIVSVFFGIVVRMFYREHEPAHFHVEYQGQHAKFDLAGNVIAGKIGSGNAMRLVRAWAVEHSTELAENWQRLNEGKPLERIAPLE